MSLSPQQLDHLAELARLQIRPDEEVALLAQLDSVMGILDRLQSVDTTGVAPMTHPHDGTLRLREDHVTEPNRRDQYQAGAPAVQDGLYLVPKVIE